MMKDLDGLKGNGGFASVKSGGVNYRFVLINFTSQTGGDINFNVGVYGDAPSGPAAPGYAPYPNNTPYRAMGWNPPSPQPPPQQPYGWRYH